MPIGGASRVVWLTRASRAIRLRTTVAAALQAGVDAVEEGIAGRACGVVFDDVVVAAAGLDWSLASRLAERLRCLGEDASGEILRDVGVLREIDAAAGAVLVAPLRGRAGWLVVARDDGGGFDEEDEAILTSLSDAVASVVLVARAEDRARVTEARYATLVEQLPATTYYRALDRPGAPSFVSPQVETLTGYRPAEFVADPSLWRTRIFEEDRERVLRMQSQASPDTLSRPICVDYRLLHRDGSLRWVQNHALTVRGEDGRPRFVMGVIFDVTEAKKLEEQLRQSLKMDAIGRLAGGVAHDFNNMLGVILSYVDLLDEEVRSRAPLGEYVDEIRNAARRSRALTQQLLVFSRQEVVEPKPLDLGKIVAAMKGMIGRLIGEDVAFAAMIDEDTWPVRGDVGQMEQVVLNLVVNARDAMPRGGDLALTVANVELGGDGRGPADLARHHVVGPFGWPEQRGRYVMLEVKDTGAGMDRATQSRIFEPFFTTKPRNQGTGLGLSTVFGIVEQNGGLIACESLVGHGTSMRVFFQADAALPVAAEAPRPPALPPRGNAERILVVEDEESLRRVICRTLRKHGYEVLEAKGGEEALRVHATQPGGVELLLTDFIMPGMNGREVAANLKERQPDLNVLYMSGYADDQLLRHGVLHAAIAIVHKPFTIPDLLAKVQTALAPSSSGVAERGATKAAAVSSASSDDGP